MESRLQNTQNWIRRIQRSSDKKKKVWLIILSGAAMTFIIGVWLVYLEFTLPKLKGVEEAKEEAPFWRVFGEGTRVVGEEMWKEIQSAKNRFTNFKNTVQKKMIDSLSNEFTIEGK